MAVSVLLGGAIETACTTCAVTGNDAGNPVSSAEASVPSVQQALPTASPAPAPAPFPHPASNEPSPKRVGVRCVGDEVAIQLADGDEICAVECTSSAKCSAGSSCDGEGVLATGAGHGSAVHFCRPGGGGKAVDAGAHPLAVPDAGPPKPLNLRWGPETAPMHAPFCRFASRMCADGLCRRLCKADSDCGPAPAHCQDGVCEAPNLPPCKK